MLKPNIIFIVLDTLRADKIPLTSKNDNLTPFIKNLLNNSIYFQNCISNSPWTLPSHISMFTGLYPTQIKLISNEIDKLTPKTPLLTEILRDMGYYTICFTENAFISKIYGLDKGFIKFFDVWDWNPWIREKYKLSFIMRFLHKVDLVINTNIKSKILLSFWKHLFDRCEKILKSLVKTLFLNNILFKLKNNTLKDLEIFSEKIKKNVNKKPFYLFFNFLTTHDPYIPLFETFKNSGITLKDFKILKNMIIFPLKTRLNVNIKSKKLSEVEVKTIKKLYNACVSSTDIVIKKVFSILNNLKLLENSFVIITSDHGEHLGDKLDNYLWEHNTYQSVYESLMRVPLIIYNKNFKKRVITSQVQLKDLFHTILHITKTPNHQNQFLELNKSILYQIENNSTPEYIFGEYLNKNDEMIELINAHLKTIKKNLIPAIFNDIHFIRSNSHKYIKYNNINIEEFYDLRYDINEQLNIIDNVDKNYKIMKVNFEKTYEKIKDFDGLKQLITKKEKNNIKKILNNIKIKGI